MNDKTRKRVSIWLLSIGIVFLGLYDIVITNGSIWMTVGLVGIALVSAVIGAILGSISDTR